MCLGVPGRLETIDVDAFGVACGIVSFGGIRKEICLAYVPDARAGDYVLVHVGFAITTIDEAEAAATFAELVRLGELSELDPQEPR
jgi:hydrogenase expression/formation protein HypC